MTPRTWQPEPHGHEEGERPDTFKKDTSNTPRARLCGNVVALGRPRCCDPEDPDKRTGNLGEESLQPPERHLEAPTVDELQRQQGARGQRRPDHVNEGP